MQLVLLKTICPHTFPLNFKFLKKTNILDIIVIHGKSAFICQIDNLWQSVEVGEFKKIYNNVWKADRDSRQKRMLDTAQ